MTPLVIEPAFELPSGIPGNRYRVHGRLILADEGLYFIHGWDEQVRLDLWWIFERNIRLRGGSLTASGDGLRPSAHAGIQMLAQYAEYPPQQQAEIIPNSRVLLREDLDSAHLVRFPVRLIVETRRHGELLLYRIPRRMRGAVDAWIAALDCPES